MQKDDSDDAPDSGVRCELTVETPPPDVGAALIEGLMRSGMVFDECEICGRPYGSRDGSKFCPPCAGKTRVVDCWFCKSGTHNSPDCPQRPRNEGV